MDRQELNALPPAQLQREAFDNNGSTRIDAGALISYGLEKGLSVDALERLLMMRREIQEELARESFFTALAAFQGMIPEIRKRQSAQIKSTKGDFKYKYADLADIERAIRPALLANGLSYTFGTDLVEGGYLVHCRVHHAAGHTETSSFFAPLGDVGRMNRTQAAGAALQYGRRYSLTAALGISTADEDDDAASCDAQNTPPGRDRKRPNCDAGGPAPDDLEWDEYPSQQPTDFRSPAAPPQSPAQKRALEAHMGELGLQPFRERIKKWTTATWGVTSLNDLNQQQSAALYDRLEDFAERIAIESEDQQQP